MKLSILCASIRSKLLPHVYKSIETAWHDTWEFVIVSPYDLPEELKDKKNIKFIKDYGSPSRGWQIALVNAEGEYVHYTADDVTYFPNTLDDSLKLLEGESDNTLIMGKYIEGYLENPLMRGEDYYHFKFHKQIDYATSGKDYLILNVGFCKRQLLLGMGGWDCKFESSSITLMDFSMRLQDEGVKIIIQKEPIFYCSWSGQPGSSDDHTPVEYAHTKYDLPLLIHIRKNLEGKIINKIDLNNWKQAPAIWKRRFGNLKENEIV